MFGIDLENIVKYCHKKNLTWAYPLVRFISYTVTWIPPAENS